MQCRAKLQLNDQPNNYEWCFQPTADSFMERRSEFKSFPLDLLLWIYERTAIAFHSINLIQLFLLFSQWL